MLAFFGARKLWQRVTTLWRAGKATKIAPLYGGKEGDLDLLYIHEGPGGELVAYLESAELRTDVTIRAEGTMADWWGKVDFVVGVEEFDDAVEVTGPIETLTAALTAAARADVLKLTASHGELTARGVRVRVDRLTMEAKAQWRETAAAVGRAFTFPDSEIPDRLETNVRQERLPAVRARNLRVLMDRFSNTPQTARAAREALSGPQNAELRLLAAVAQGADGIPTLEKVAGGEFEATAPNRIEAFERLKTLVPPKEMIPLVSSLLKGECPPALRAAALEQAEAEHLHAIRHWVRSGEGDVERAAAQAFARVATVDWEFHLLGEIEQAPAPIARVLFPGLQRIGTLRIVPALMAFDAPASLQGLVRSTIKAIQVRHGVGSEGSISLSEPKSQEGALSIAPVPKKNR